MKKTCTRILSLLLVAALAVCLLSGCAATDKLAISKMLHRFEKACRAEDADAMLDCINPSLVNPVRTTLSLFGVASLNDTLSSIMELLGAFDFKGANTADVLKTVKIAPRSFSFSDDGKNCDVFADITYTLNGSEVTGAYIIRCGKVGSEWFIMGLS